MVPIFNKLYLKIHTKINLALLLLITLKFYFHALHKMNKYNFLKSLAVSNASKFTINAPNTASKMQQQTPEILGKSCRPCATPCNVFLRLNRFPIKKRSTFNFGTTIGYVNNTLTFITVLTNINSVKPIDPFFDNSDGAMLL